MPSPTFLASFGLIGLRLIALHGLDPQRFVGELGLPGTSPADADARLPSGLLDQAFELAMQRIPDTAFALRAGECWHPSHLGTLGYAWLSSGSLRTALRRMERHTRLLGQRMTSRCEEAADGLRYVFDHGRGATPVGYALADYHLSIVVSMCRLNLGLQVNADAATLRRPMPTDRRPWDDAFGCAVRFGASEDSFLLSIEHADLTLPTANRGMAATLDQILARQLAELTEEDLESRCRHWLAQQLTSGEPTQAELATALHMSQRSLQRRLEELGLSYRSLLEKTRLTLAQGYLADSARSITEITFLLGFSEQSAFTRAFRRWTGMTPSTFRIAGGIIEPIPSH